MYEGRYSYIGIDAGGVYVLCYEYLKEASGMGIEIGLPMMKLGRQGGGTKRRGNLSAVIKEAWLSEAKDGTLYRCSRHYDRERVGLNEYTGYRMADDLIAAIGDKVDAYAADYKERTGRAMRGDAVIGYAFIVKPPAEWMNSLTPKQREQFWRDSNEITDRILGDTIMAATIQRDEQGEHRHIIGMPWTKDGRLSARDFMTSDLFRQFNRDYPREMRAKGWDIDDAIIYDPDAEKDMTPEQKKAYRKECREKKKNSGLSSDAYMRKQEEQRQAKIAELDARIEKLAEKEQKAEELSRGPLIGRAARKAEARAKDAEGRQKAAEDVIEAARAEKQALDDQIREQRAILQSIEQATEQARKDAEEYDRQVKKSSRELQVQVNGAKDVQRFLGRVMNGQERATAADLFAFMKEAVTPDGRTLYEQDMDTFKSWLKDTARDRYASLEDTIADATRRAAKGRKRPDTSNIRQQPGRSNDYEIGD